MIIILDSQNIIILVSVVLMILNKKIDAYYQRQKNVAHGVYLQAV